MRIAFLFSTFFLSINAFGQLSGSDVKCVLNAIDEFKEPRIKFTTQLKGLSIPDKPEYDDIREISKQAIAINEEILAILAKEYITRHPDKVFSLAYTFQPSMDPFNYFSSAEIEELAAKNSQFYALTTEYDRLVDEAENTLVGRSKTDEEKMTAEEVQPKMQKLFAFFYEEKERILSKCE